jgi:hypothetical protein
MMMMMIIGKFVTDLEGSFRGLIRLLGGYVHWMTEQNHEKVVGIWCPARFAKSLPSEYEHRAVTASPTSSALPSS